MGRDVGRNEGHEQAEWRDLVARLEIGGTVDPEHAPWPDRENLSPKTQTAAGTTSAAEADGSQPGGAEHADDKQCQPGGTTPPNPPHGQPGGTTPANPPRGQPGGAIPPNAPQGQPGGATPANPPHGERGSADRGRVIRPAGPTRSSGPDGESSAGPDDASGPPAPGGPSESGELAATFTPAGPRDYELDEPRDDDFDDGGRYVPPPVPPQPRLDPVAKGAWIALFGGPGYLLIATLLGWQIAGWAALAAVIAFVTGFIVLVIRLGDGPSKRDGPDQGAVV